MQTTYRVRKENMWTETLTTARKATATTDTSSQPEQPNKTKSKNCRIFLSLLSRQINRHWNFMEMMWTKKKIKGKNCTDCSRWKGPWPLGVRKRNGKIVFFFSHNVYTMNVTKSTLHGIDANVIDSTIALQIGHGSSSRGTMENYRPIMRIQ